MHGEHLAWYGSSRVRKRVSAVFISSVSKSRDIDKERDKSRSVKIKTKSGIIGY